MRIFAEGMPDVALTDMMAKLSKTEAADWLPLTGKIEHSHAGGLPIFAEFGVAYPEVGRDRIDAVFARADIQDRLRAMLELKWAVENELRIALNIDFVDMHDDLTLQYQWALEKETKPGN